MVPDWCTARRLIKRINVDFPDPDGPQRITRSPGATLSSMLFRALKSANHLETPFMVMMAAGFEVFIVRPMLWKNRCFRSCHPNSRESTTLFRQIGRASCRERVCQYV